MEIAIIIFIIVIALMVIAYLFIAIKIIQANEMGVRRHWGVPVSLEEKGFKFLWWPRDTIQMYTREQMRLDFIVKSIVSKAGRIKGHKGFIQSTEIDLKCSLYCYWDPTKLLTHASVNSPGPTLKDVGSTLGKYAMDAIRTIGSRIPWRLTNQERQNFSEWVVARLVPLVDDSDAPMGHHWLDSDPNINDKIVFNAPTPSNNFSGHVITEAELEKVSPFVQFGIHKVTLSIEDVTFTDPEVKKSVSASEKAQLDGDAVEITAKAMREKLKAEGEGSAYARKKMVEAIKDHPDLEAMRVFEKMAQGTSNTIWYQIPEALASKMSNLFGGQNELVKLFDMLDPADRQKVLNVAKNSIASLTGGTP